MSKPTANEAEPVPRRGGRRRSFAGETVKVALFLPPDLASELRAFAARHRQTPSLLVAEWLRIAEIRDAISRGREDFERGEVVDHEEAVRRLSKW